MQWTVFEEIKNLTLNSCMTGEAMCAHRRHDICDRVWEKPLEVLVVEPDYEWLMIDARHCNVHPHAAGVVGGN